ncbi:hypothetical protein [Natronorubrum thiooxidans]|uniref:Uncharacterized protein n=1 Tax=Natronorubrum thiooxidans TaxID=308853 RepID=A0A1N7DZ13_9EURY|nr:hypothetical protein [Natronorubrum thiooxidans]SIR81074.1 hypothetical protein SAMN05421752_10350 [Natronorubrum thiooxidans]
MSRCSALARRTGIAGVVAVLTLAVTAGGVAASNVAIGLSGQSDGTPIPIWLSLVTGGGVIATSMLLTMLVTDRTVVERFHTNAVGFSNDRLETVGSLVFGTIGIATLVFVVVVGLVGPQIGSFSATVLLTFVGGRALLTIIAYTVGNPWRALNPWRHIAAFVPNGYATYPPWLGSWPAVGTLLVLIWLEVVTPLTSSPRTLVAVILAYSVFTIGGAIVFTPQTWFQKGDPISVWFRLYGAVAPIQRTEAGLEVRYPGARLGDDDLITDGSVLAFVLVLIWELTYSGFIVTGPGVRTVETLVGIGFPPQLVYLGLLLGGFALFWKGYWLAAARTRNRTETHLSRGSLAIRFGSPLLAIAAGYHFAHYAGFSLSLWPSLVDTMVSPLNPPENPTQYLLTSWFSYVELTGILVGHLLAVWLTHVVSFELFSGKRQAVRSQYPFIIVMVVLAVVNLYLVAVPPMDPVYVPN